MLEVSKFNSDHTENAVEFYRCLNHTSKKLCVSVLERSKSNKPISLNLPFAEVRDNSRKHLQKKSFVMLDSVFSDFDRGCPTK